MRYDEGMPDTWRLFVDTGGTFTDCLAQSPEGGWKRAKVLSSGELRLTETARAELGESFFAGYKPGQCREAPILAAHLVTRTPLNAPLPPLTMRLGTTRGTNALLTRTGVPPVLFLTEGFEDILLIGDQSRPDLFVLDIVRPDPLWSEVIGVRERLGADGSVLRALDEKRLRAAAKIAVEQGHTTSAIALLHSWINPEQELRAASILYEEGFVHVSISSELSPLQRLVPRAQTALVDAYLAPVLSSFLTGVAAGTERLAVMTSAGGLVPQEAFRARDSLLSGPAGGVVGALAAGRAAGFEKLIAFDMGGTSTDVCRLESAGAALTFEHGIGDIRLLAPAVAVESVAAGGGSICYRDSQGRLAVGPESAGAAPGPACYGQGGPLTITDVNLLLGRIDPATFSVPLDVAAAECAADALTTQVGVNNRDELLYGLLALADEAMADAIRQISVRQGVDPADYALVAFGGAGGQHACAVAERLGITTVLVPPDQSLLSAYGLSQAVLSRIAERQVLAPLASVSIENLIEELELQATQAVIEGGANLAKIVPTRRIVRLRLLGQETPLDIECDGPAENLTERFAQQFETLYGYQPAASAVLEVESIRVVCEEQALLENPPAPTRLEAPVDGPNRLVEAHSVTWVAEGWQANPTHSGALQLIHQQQSKATVPESVAVELFARRFSAIAEEMGETLRRAALSVNVKERLDYSCALLGPEGTLVASAAHIPVHLGALGVCVRSLLSSGYLYGTETVVLNHPAFGGSHLPDITLVTPVFAESGERLGFVASRAHHAELGGTRPGSMPPGATTLLEEGVVIPPTPYDRELLTRILTGSPYPTRALAHNLADLDAQYAANRQGASALARLACAHGAERIFAMQEQLAADGSSAVRAALIPRAGIHEAREKLDDGSLICVRITIAKTGEAIFDFTGTGAQHPASFNAPPAVVQAAVLYVLRLLVGSDVPLGEGLLRLVELRLPEGSLVNPHFAPDPAKCPAVVAGNTEVSQRLVQVLLKALGLSAGSQATMNNVLFGDEAFGYYETVCGGAGATATAPGASGVHTHMTNTRITDPEVLENRCPVRLEKFALRRGSGGKGKHQGGDGVVREYRFLRPLSLSLLTQSRAGNAPFGLNGGRPGQPGRQRLLRRDGGVEELLAVAAAEVRMGDRLRLETPGGGGYGNKG
ncbi:MAG: hydantoinase B/oxoprolinase family protein [Armatimonas sp.]